MKKLAINIVRAELCPKRRYLTSRIAAIVFLITFFIQTTQAQNNSAVSLTGTIYSAADQKPLPGATISTADNKTISDENGKFRLVTQDASGSLKISYVGFKLAQIEFSKNNRGPFIISLIADASSLKEVIVSTGYQTLPKERAIFRFNGSRFRRDNSCLKGKSP
jgi:hypothetical protein